MLIEFLRIETVFSRHSLRCHKTHTRRAGTHYARFGAALVQLFIHSPHLVIVSDDAITTTPQKLCANFADSSWRINKLLMV